MKENDLEVLNHQLQGIMDCSAMINLFCLLKLPRMYKYQRKRMHELMTVFQQMNQWYITKYQELPNVSTFFQKIFTVATPDSKELIPIVIEAWINWETKGMEVYSQLMSRADSFTELKFWNKLVTITKFNLYTAKLCKRKYPLPEVDQLTPEVDPVETITPEVDQLIPEINPVEPITPANNIRQRVQERLAATQN